MAIRWHAHPQFSVPGPEMTREFSTRSVLAGITLLLGATVIVGWFARVPALVQVLPGLQAMTLGTALCFLLSGVALMLPGIAPRRAPGGQSALGLAVIALAGAMLVEHLTNVELGIDLP